MTPLPNKTMTGKCSTFGGPDDTGVAPAEGLALMSRADLTQPPFAHYFLGAQPKGTTGLARRLNPATLYIACRWDYTQTPLRMLRRAFVTVKNPANGKSINCRPVDWGPNEKTGRIADLSPGAMEAVGAKTDDELDVMLNPLLSHPGQPETVRENAPETTLKPDALPGEKRGKEPRRQKRGGEETALG